ncbi:protein FAM98B-like [Juglans microcarpa x Juglans regia]|uniref:protein FAM98B-like n=1 Tax=Juglans microcarpa x Juglans regia TaxID=2249226 RepID=UPI001B7E0651|nr:protein FAM98B-like [Juglans microcarpa x Juglans regia]
MDTTIRFSRLVLFIAIAIGGLKGDETGSGTAHSQSNSTNFALPKLLQGNEDNEGRNKTSTEVVLNKKNINNGPYFRGQGRGGGGGGGGGGGWGGGGGGGGYKWGCGGQPRHGKGEERRAGILGGMNNNHAYRKRVFSKDIDNYKLGEFAQCMRRGRCRGMRLDCPLHCGGPCFYDCQHMCKAHCRRLS